jgi:hypothetical protein
MSFVIDHEHRKAIAAIEDMAALVMIRIGIFDRLGRCKPEPVLDALDQYVRAVRRHVGADDGKV